MSNTHAISLKRSTALLAALSLLAMLFVVNFSAFFSSAEAAQLGNRKLTLSSTLPGTVSEGAPGSETNGAEAVHTFTFTKSAESDDADRIAFQYCTTAIGTCTIPTGLDLENVAVGTGTNVTLSSVAESGTNEEIALVTVTGVTAGTSTLTVPLTTIVNPNITDAFYVRITMYEAAAPGTILDDGVVASAITEGITITTRVAETLGFSVTGEVDSTNVGDPTSGGTTACAPVTGSGAIQIGDPNYDYTLDMTETYDALSAFRIYTNATAGTVVQYEGELPTRTSGGITINSIGATATATAVGTEQFGLAMALNGVGSDAPGSGDFLYVSNQGDWGATPGTLNVDANYDGGTGDIGTAGSDATFAYVPSAPTTIASASSYVECRTGLIRYVAGASPLTPSGTYTTTVVYSAVPTY